MPITSPNMSLPIPIPGVDTGLVWEQSIQSALQIIDQHYHIPTGGGVLLNPNSINVNTSWVFNGNGITQLGPSYFTVQPSALANTELSVIYAAGIGGDLFFNDGAGNAVQITTGGSVNATSSGISSPPASAAFVGSILVVDSNTNTPASIQAGSYLMGQTGVSGSNILTLSPPSALSGGSYSLVLPSVPSATELLTIDNSGNISTASTVTESLTINGGLTLGSGDLFVNAGDITASGQIESTTLFATARVIAGTFFTWNGSNVQLFPQGNNGLKIGDASSGNSAIAVTGPTNSTNSQRIIRGVITNTGTIVSGEGFTVTSYTSGVCTVAFSTHFTDVPAVNLTSILDVEYIAATSISGAGFVTNSDLGNNVEFSFIAIGIVTV